MTKKTNSSKNKPSKVIEVVKNPASPKAGPAAREGIRSDEQAVMIQKRRIASGKKGIAKAVTRFIKKALVTGSISDKLAGLVKGARISPRQPQSTKS